MNVTKRKQSMLKEVTASSLTHIFMLNMALFGKKIILCFLKLLKFP